MTRYILMLLIFSTALLFSGTDFLENTSARDLIIWQIDVISNEIKSEIMEKDMDYWFLPSGNVAYSSDDLLIAEDRKNEVSGQSLGLWVVNTRKNTEKQLTPNTSSCMAWSRDSKYLAYIQYEYNPNTKIVKKRKKPAFNSERLCIYNHGTGEINDIVFMKGFAIKFKWSPVGHRLAYTYVDHESGKYILMVFDVDADKRYRVDEILLCDLWNFDWAPNGEMIVYTKPLEMDRLIDEEVPLKSDVFIADYIGGEIFQITNTPAVELFVKWSSDGKHILTELVNNPKSGYDPSYKILELQKREIK